MRFASYESEQTALADPSIVAISPVLVWIFALRSA